MADEIPEETKASQEVVKEAGRTAKDVGKSLLDIAKVLLAGRKGRGAGRQLGGEAGRDGQGRVEALLVRAPAERLIILQRDPFEHLRIAQRQAARELEKLYREARRRSDRGDPMDLREFASREGGIVERMGPTGEAQAKRMRENAFSKGPVRSAKAPVRSSEGRVRTPATSMSRSAMMAMNGLSRGPSAPAPLPIAALARGMGGRGR